MTIAHGHRRAGDFQRDDAAETASKVTHGIFFLLLADRPRRGGTGMRIASVQFDFHHGSSIATLFL